MLKISYDYTGKVSIIHIQIDDYFAQVPFNPETQSIDWESIDYEPTRQSIQSAWDEWAKDKDLAYELRDRPDLAPDVPIIVNPPNWNLFSNSLLKNSAYARISETSTNQSAVRRLETIAISASVSKEEVDINLIALFWDSMINGIALHPTTEEIAGWSAIAASSFIPVKFDNAGLIFVVQ